MAAAVGALTAERPLRVAVVGAGPMGRIHVRTVRRLGVLLTGVCDRDASALEEVAATWPGTPTWPTLEGLLEGGPRPDVVHVCTPPASHAPLALTALRAGCHVYVEKPVATGVEEAEDLLRAAAERELMLCPGHQLLFTSAAVKALERLPSLGRLAHAESFFSFRSGGGGWREAAAVPGEAQLLDVLPHGVYPLLRALEAAEPDAALEIPALEVGRGGTVHALLRRGWTSGTVVVTLSGRPVESRLRLVGSAGTLEADFVRDSVRQIRGEGASSLEKVLNPLRVAGQLVAGTALGVGRRVLAGDRYPGLASLLETFYGAVRTGAAPPLDPDHVRDAARIQGRVRDALESARAPGVRLPPGTGGGERPAPRVAVTGGTGFLGTEVGRALVRRGVRVRAVARHLPPAWERIPGVEYVTADLAHPVPGDVFRGCEAVVHCAAETAGGWSGHERNSVQATREVVRAAARAGVARVVHVSSLAVAAPDGDGVGGGTKGLLPEARSRELGAYVWGKAESERQARSLAEEWGGALTVVRPGPIVDPRRFEPPGRLGRRIGRLYLAVGDPDEAMAVVEVGEAARAVAEEALRVGSGPETFSLVSPSPPTRGELVELLRASRPELRVVWLRRPLFEPLARAVTWLQRRLPTDRPIVDVAAIFGRDDVGAAGAPALPPRAPLT